MSFCLSLNIWAIQAPISTKFIACIGCMEMFIVNKFHDLSSIHSSYKSNFLSWPQATPRFHTASRIVTKYTLNLSCKLKTVVLLKYSINLCKTYTNPRSNRQRPQCLIFCWMVCSHMRSPLNMNNTFYEDVWSFYILKSPKAFLSNIQENMVWLDYKCNSALYHQDSEMLFFV